MAAEDGITSLSKHKKAPGLAGAFGVAELT